MNDLLSVSPPFILASQSPRRRVLLEQVGLDFRVHVSPADEHTDELLSPRETARALARKKARPVATDHPSALVLAADTVVIHEDELLGKPSSPAHARRMLDRLSDTTHTVYTGVALHHAENERAVATGRATHVTFADLSDAEIRAYVETESPMDKAGGYGIQDHTGPLFVDHLEGDYYNVVGLPLRLLYCTLQSHFADLLRG
jgi:septum formation protein